MAELSISASGEVRLDYDIVGQITWAGPCAHLDVAGEWDQCGGALCWDCGGTLLEAENAVSVGASDIAAERRRQITTKGFDAENDQQHCEGELTIAAINYAAACVFRDNGCSTRPLRYGGVFSGLWAWPWAPNWWKPKDARSDLVRAGALIAAEIDRLDRAAATQMAAP